MELTTQKVQTQIGNLIAKAVEKAFSAGVLPGAESAPFIIEVPADKRNGDFSTNAAMVNAKNFRLPPRKIAETIVSFASNEDTYFEKIEVAGPGFINFFLNDAYYADVLLDIRKAGESYGKSDYGKGKRLNVEFVSANPTGPMHIGNARGGALGDSLSSVLQYAGYEVEREFYVNDAGNQIEKFGKSLSIRYLQIADKNNADIIASFGDDVCAGIFADEEHFPMPEDVYKGVDIIEHAYNFYKMHKDSFADADEETRKSALVEYALPLNIDGLERDLKKYRIVYDTWFRESTLHANGAVKQIVDMLTEKGQKEAEQFFEICNVGTYGNSV